jgi:hypothetical protein
MRPLATDLSDDYVMGPASAMRMAGFFGGAQKRQEVTEGDVAKVRPQLFCAES